MSVNKRRRFEVFHRDGFTCRYCGRKPPEVVLEVDHIVAVANGGGDEIENLATACFDCNNGKSATPLAEKPESVEERMSRRREALEQVQAYNEFVAHERQVIQEIAEAVGVYWFNHIKDEPNKFTFGTERMKSVIRFVKALPIDEVYEAVDLAMQRCPPTRSTGYDDRTFRYFCAVCWNKIRG